MLGELISAAASIYGGERANQANMDRQEAANAFSAQQFATRYQTTVKDMQAAGLNPMLAYSQGGGNAPSGQVGAPMQNSIGAGVDSYNRTKATNAQAALQNEQIKVAETQANLNSAQASKVNEEAELIKTDRLKREQEVPYVQQQTKTSEQQASAYAQQAIASAQQAVQSQKQVEVLNQNIDNLKAELKKIQQNNDQQAPESEIAKKYPTTYYIFHKLLPSLSGSIGKPFNYRQ